VGKGGFSKPEELDREAGEADGRTGEGVAEAFHGTEPDETDAPSGNQHHRHHGSDGCECKDSSHQYHASHAVLCGGIHDQGNQRFAGAEHEDRKQDPRGERLSAVFVGMGVFMQV